MPDEDLTEGLDEVEDVAALLFGEDDDASTEPMGRTVSGPEDLFGGEDDTVPFEVPSGKFWPDGEPKTVAGVLNVPDAASDLFVGYMAYAHKPDATLSLWEHFVEEPVWLLNEAGHGLHRHPDTKEFVKVGTDAHAKAFPDPKVQDEHHSKVFPSMLIDRLTDKIRRVAGVDGDFLEARLEMVPTDVRRRLSRLAQRSQQKSEGSVREKLTSGRRKSEPESTTTSESDASDDEPKQAQTSSTPSEASSQTQTSEKTSSTPSRSSTGPST